MSDIVIGSKPTSRHTKVHDDEVFIEAAIANRGEWVSRPPKSTTDANTYSRLYNKIGRKLGIQVRVTV